MGIGERCNVRYTREMVYQATVYRGFTGLNAKEHFRGVPTSYNALGYTPTLTTQPRMLNTYFTTSMQYLPYNCPQIISLLRATIIVCYRATDR